MSYIRRIWQRDSRDGDFPDHVVDALNNMEEGIENAGGGGGGAPSGTAGGVLAGTYPNPVFAADMATQAELDAKRLDQVAAPTGDVSLNSQKIIGLAAPTGATEAANKAYVDAIASGLNVKLSVRAATTANITLSGAQTIDGVSVVATNRVLVKNQTTGSENGIYVAAAGAWARSTDADADVEVTAGMFTFVTEGTVNGDQGWALVTNNPITVGTTALAFTQFSGAAGSGPPSGAAGGVLGGSYPNPSFAADMATQVELDAHINDTTAAHTAASIAFTPDGSIAATTVQLAIQEVRDEAGVGGGSVNDQTISTTDNTTNNVSTSKHGWTPKLDGNRSHYLSGTSGWERPHSVKEWFVDSTVAAGGDGHSPGGAFQTFAAAIAAAGVRDVIYVLSDLTENLNINVQDIRVVGVGRRVIYGNGSSSANNITVHINARQVSFENFLIYGHATFKGVHLCMDSAARSRIVNVDIDGCGGNFNPTFYPNGPAGSTGTKTGNGGIGILIHNCEPCYYQDISYVACSIGIALGTRTTGQVFEFGAGGASSGCCQYLVVGLDTGTYTNTLTGSGPYTYGGADQCGTGCTYKSIRFVSPSQNTTTSPPMVDIIGDGTTDNSGEFGGTSLWMECSMIEGSGSFGVIRIGTRKNTFINCSGATGNLWKIEGRHCMFENFWSNGAELYLRSTGNRVVNYLGEGLARVSGDGSGNQFINCYFQSSSLALDMTGSAQVYDHCWFSSTPAITRAKLGPFPTIKFDQFDRVLTYGTTIATSVDDGGLHTIPVTNGTAFTISNPIDGSNFSNSANMLIGGDLTYDIKNSSGGAMGAITWGSKFLLAGAFTNPANGKRRTITFHYNATDDLWIEMNRAAADI